MRWPWDVIGYVGMAEVKSPKWARETAWYGVSPTDITANIVGAAEEYLAKGRCTASPSPSPSHDAPLLTACCCMWFHGDGGAM